MTNEEEAKLLSESPDKYAKGIYDGIINFFDNIKPLYPDEPKVEPEPEDLIKIFVDQGRNPSSHDLGVDGNGLSEHNITYSVGNALAELLKKDGRFDVALSRNSEDEVLGEESTVKSSLDARIKGAVDFSAECFISLRVNAYSDPLADGIETYALADSDGYALSKDILSATALSTALDVRSAKTEKNDMYLLEEVSKALPSVAATEIYLGFITSEKDSACMKNTPELFAEGIYNGILAYYFG